MITDHQVNKSNDFLTSVSVFYFILPMFSFKPYKMSLEEFEDNGDKKSSRYALMKSIVDFTMGIIYIAVGLLILFATRLHIKNDFLLSFAASIAGKIFAGVVILYGLWRIYRGIKKDYFR